jgi:hypothetical protein
MEIVRKVGLNCPVDLFIKAAKKLIKHNNLVGEFGTPISGLLNVVNPSRVAIEITKISKIDDNHIELTAKSLDNVNGRYLEMFNNPNMFDLEPRYIFSEKEVFIAAIDINVRTEPLFISRLRSMVQNDEKTNPELS